MLSLKKLIDRFTRGLPEPRGGGGGCRVKLLRNKKGAKKWKGQKRLAITKQPLVRYALHNFHHSRDHVPPSQPSAPAFAGYAESLIKVRSESFRILPGLQKKKVF
jgi:hypothetical protein